MQNTCLNFPVPNLCVQCQCVRPTVSIVSLTLFNFTWSFVKHVVFWSYLLYKQTLTPPKKTMQVLFVMFRPLQNIDHLSIEGMWISHNRRTKQCATTHFWNILVPSKHWVKTCASTYGRRGFCHTTFDLLARKPSASVMVTGGSAARAREQKLQLTLRFPTRHSISLIHRLPNVWPRHYGL